jgi:CubicO group peptidase (beta-lactamase class C family)
MRDTRIALTPNMNRRLAVGHTAQLEAGVFEGTGALEGAGDLHSTTNDLLTLLEAFMGTRSTRLQGAMALTMERLVPTEQASTVIGLGLRKTNHDGHEIIWNNGRSDGFRTFIGYSPSTRIGVVALANAGTDQGAEDIAQHLFDPYYPVNLQAPADHAETRIAAALLDRYVGRYEFEDKTFITVTRIGNQLMGEATGQAPFEMFAESETGFFLKEVDAQITFDVTGNLPASALTLHQGGQQFRAVRVP